MPVDREALGGGAAANGPLDATVVQLRRAGSENNRSDVSIKKGGRQIEYEDQDPRIHPLWLRELAITGVPSRMGKFFDEEAMLRELKTSAAE